MKKILLASVILLCATATFAQHSYFGIKGGVNFSRLTYKGANATDFRTGFHAGLLEHVHINKTFAIQPELLYSSQGDESTLIGVNTAIKRRLNYISLPIIVQYMFDNGFRLEAGPQIGFLIKAESKFGAGSANIKDGIESTDFGLAAGIGYLGKSGLGIDGRYVFGLSNIDKSNTVTSHSNVAQFGLFYMFHHTANKNIRHRN